MKRKLRTCPVMVNSNISKNRRGHFALYALWDHNLCAPAVIPNPEVYITTNAATKRIIIFIALAFESNVTSVFLVLLSHQTYL